MHPSRMICLMALAAAACAGPPGPPSPADVARMRQDYLPGVSPIACYRTLARADCYAERQPGPPNRLIGSWDRLPEP